MTHESIAFITPEELATIVRKESETYRVPEEEFVKDNSMAYEVLLNTWCLIVCNLVSERAAKGLKDEIMEHGVYQTIETASDAFDKMANKEPLTGFWAWMFTTVTSVPGQFGVLPSHTELDAKSFGILSQIMKYPKRFSPYNVTTLNERALQSFHERQREIREFYRNADNTTFLIVDLMRDTISKILDWDRLCDEIEEAWHNDEFILTTGACCDAKSPAIEKLRAISRRLGYVPGSLMADMDERWAAELHHESILYNIEPIKLIPVPKSYKIARIIAPETAYNAAYGKVGEKIIDKYLPYHIDIHNQDTNRLLAGLGSRDKDVDTLDQSAASDYCSAWLCRRIFPERFMKLWESIRNPKYTYAPKGKKERTYTLESESTMGHPYTFVIECCLFLSAALVGAKIFEDLTGEKALPRKILEMEPFEDGTVKFLLLPGVVGDDLTIDSRTTSIVVWVLEKLGFHPNLSKSFSGDNPFREACGKEFFDGMDVTPVYFPRRPLAPVCNWEKEMLKMDSYKGDIKSSVSTLVSIQQSLAPVSSSACEYMYHFIKDYVPTMTASQFGTPSSDVWFYTDEAGKRFSPHAEISHFFVKRKKGGYLWIPDTQITEESVPVWCETATEEMFLTLQRIKQTQSLIDTLPFDQTEFWNQKLVSEREHLLELESNPDRYETIFRSEEYGPVVRANFWKFIAVKHEDSYYDVHWAPKPKFTTSYKVREKDVHWDRDQYLLDMYFYNRFLKEGPEYLDPADTTIGQFERSYGITHLSYKKDGHYVDELFETPTIAW